MLTIAAIMKVAAMLKIAAMLSVAVYWQSRWRTSGL